MDNKPNYIILTKTEEAGNSRIALHLDKVIYLEPVKFPDGAEGTRIYAEHAIIEVIELIDEILKLSKSVYVGLTN